MRRQNHTEIEVNSPVKGLITRVPSNQAEKSTGRAMTVAENVRFEDGVARNASGTEAMVICPPDALGSSGTILFVTQSNIVSDLTTVQKDAPIIGTESKLYQLDRRFGTECLPGDPETGPECVSPVVTIATQVLTGDSNTWDLSTYACVTPPDGYNPECGNSDGMWVLKEIVTYSVVYGQGIVRPHPTDATKVCLVGLSASITVPKSCSYTLSLQLT